MKNILTMLVIGIFLISFTSAIQMTGSATQNSRIKEVVQATANSDKIQEKNQTSVTEIRNQFGEKIKAGEFVIENGEKLRIHEHNQNKIRLEVSGINASTSLNLTQEQIQNRTRLKAKLRNGTEREIKIMPDTASETALARLRLKNCNESNNCSIELKEVGQGNQTKIAYEVQAEKQAKILGLFRTKIQVESQVDAETGEVIQTKRPWWSFLVRENDEE